MPWSGWIQSEPVLAFAGEGTWLTSRGSGAAGSDGQGALDAAYAAQPSGTLSTVTSTSNPAERSEVVSNLGGWFATVTDSQKLYWFSAAKAGVPDGRNWFPPELWPLTEGVDYTIRPDRTLDDPDAYVEYEPDGATTLLGWDAETGIEIINTSQDGMGAEVGYDFAPIPTEGDTPWMDAGTVVQSLAVITGPGSAQSPAVDFGAELGLAPVWRLGVRTIGGGTYVPGPSPVWNGDLFLDSISARIQYPRWRYWMPGRLPLRQRQRDDGLGMSGTPRWRGGTSRQSSNRWRGYL